MRPARWIAAAMVAVALLGAAACSDDEEGSTDDSTPAAVADPAEGGETTGPTAVDDGTFNPDPTVTIPVDPAAIPVPEVGQAALVIGGVDVPVELASCEVSPELGLDLSMNPPDAGEDNPAGFVLLTGTQPVAGSQALGTPGAALQMPGLPLVQPEGVLTIAQLDPPSGVVQFAYPVGETEAVEGYAAFSC